eukprot:TRINITY_DN859_c0_g1_i1.p2 TRINITY_DN859_c0_g1~~TRINITY_DN859_c0_g1_i1.p2  ORF type:complete len:147 (+),score=41.66 TRINITY_DN859_c0_g1_i1:139-579(+)
MEFATAKHNGLTVKDVEALRYIKELAQHLKKSGQIELPKWVDLVKTAPTKEIAPVDPDWYFIRLASIARRIYLHPGLGVGGLRRLFGEKSRNKVSKSHVRLAAGSIIRTCLQDLEKMKMVEKAGHGGRKISKVGRRELDQVAARFK